MWYLEEGHAVSISSANHQITFKGLLSKVCLYFWQHCYLEFLIIILSQNQLRKHLDHDNNISPFCARRYDFLILKEGSFPEGSEAKNCLQWRKHRRCELSGKWQPTPISLSGKFHGQRSLVSYSPWCHKELNKTEHTLMQRRQTFI